MLTVQSQLNHVENMLLGFEATKEDGEIQEGDVFAIAFCETPECQMTEARVA